MANFRVERDFLGEREVPEKCYFGIHTLRASENFALTGRRIHRDMIKAICCVKKSAAQANLEIAKLSEPAARAIIQACEETSRGDFDEFIVVDPLQGGAGTATNMNFNEVLANRANEILGHPLGSYEPVHPNDHVNLGQSTNDVFPTALRIAAIWNLRELVKEVASLQELLQKKESEFSGIPKIGRTQLQDAIPITLGAEFSSWGESFSRDRWRLYHLEERLRVVNIGGTAIGTGLNADRQYQFTIIRRLQDETGIGLARAENLVEATQNADVFCEASGLLKPLAVNLMKMANDFRLLASGPNTGIGEIILPAVQEGSSIMPGKVNPVMCEMVNQISMKIYGNDLAITHAADSGQLELNAFLPLIMDALLESLCLLKKGISLFAQRCVSGIKPNQQRCKEHLQASLGLITLLTPRFGHQKMSEMYLQHLRTKIPICKLLVEEKLLTELEIEQLLSNIR